MLFLKVKKFFKRSIFTVFLFYILGVIHCCASSSFKLIKDGTLVVCTNTPYEPFEFKKGDEIVGADIDVIKEIAKRLQLNTEIHDVSFDALTFEISNKKCDCAIAAMSPTEEKRKSVDFSDPYFCSNQRVIVRKNSQIKSPDDLKPDMNIGVQLGTTGHSYCSDKYKVVTYSTPNDAIQDLQNKKGELDAVVMDELPAKRFAFQFGDKIKLIDDPLFSEEFCIAFPKGNSSLINAVNEILRDLRSSKFVEHKIEEYTPEQEYYKNDFLNQIRMNLIDENRWKQIANGFFITLKITSFSLIIGVILGYLAAVVTISPSKNLIVTIFKYISKFYISVVRGTPVVCQLFIIYYLILSPLGVNKILCAIVAFGINSGAYVSEIIRSGILSVDIGQIEAGKALGLNDRQIMVSIIAPQALKNSLATLCNEFMQLIKETSVAGFIGVNELTRSGDIIRSQTLSPFVPLMTTALIYFSVVHLVGMLMSFFEKRLRKSDKS